MSDRVVLASASQVRARLLRDAGIEFKVAPAAIDEAEVKAACRAESEPVTRAAELLAELKACRVSRSQPTALVIGVDQILHCEGEWLDKPPDLVQARRHLQGLRGKTHELVTSAVAVLDQERIWHRTTTARLTMRPFSDRFLDGYLETIGAQALVSVGGYQLEGLGVQLFSRIEGDYFTVLGLPLLPLLDFLRQRSVLET